MISCNVEKEGRKRRGGELSPEWDQDSRYDGKEQEECKGEGYNEATSSVDQGKEGNVKGAKKRSKRS